MTTWGYIQQQLRNRPEWTNEEFNIHLCKQGKFRKNKYYPMGTHFQITALGIALASHQHGFLRYLLEHKANVNQPICLDQTSTPLYVAIVKEKSPDVVRILIESNASLTNLASDSHWNACHYIAMTKSFGVNDCIQMLRGISYGHLLLERDHHHRTPLDVFIVVDNNSECIQFFQSEKHLFVKELLQVLLEFVPICDLLNLILLYF